MRLRGFAAAIVEIVVSEIEGVVIEGTGPYELSIAQRVT